MSVRIAISAWNALPAVVPQSGEAIGGLETFAWQMARELGKRAECHVCLVVRGPGRPTRSIIDGVELVTHVEQLRIARDHVSRFLGFLKSRRLPPGREWTWSLLWQLPAVLAIRAIFGSGHVDRKLRRFVKTMSPSRDVWIALGCSKESALAIGERKEGTTLLWIRSNSELDERLLNDPAFVNEYGVSGADAIFCLKESTAVLCQTDWQRDRLFEMAGREGMVIRNPIDTCRWPESQVNSEDRKYVLWIGRYDRMHKRPLLALEIARAHPEIPFRMVINRGDSGVEKEVRDTRPENVTLMDYVPHREMPALFSGARVFLSTGSFEFEGFPNVLLEAAAAGVPSVSLEDFDAFLEKSGGGFSCRGDVTEAAERISEIWNSNTLFRDLGTAGRRYVVEYHSIEHAASQLLGVIARYQKKSAS